MKSNGEFEIGDEVQIIQNGYHNTSHHFYVAGPHLRKEEKYIVEDIDYSENGQYIEMGTLKIGGTAYGALGVKLIKPVENLKNLMKNLDEKILAMERRLNYGEQP